MIEWFVKKSVEAYHRMSFNLTGVYALISKTFSEYYKKKSPFYSYLGNKKDSGPVCKITFIC